MGKTRDTGNLVDNTSGSNTGDQDLSTKSPYPKYATAASVTTTSATAVDITGLIIAVGANKTYRITAAMTIQCDNTGGLRFTIIGPSGAAVVAGTTWVGSGASVSATQNTRQLAMGTLTTTGLGFNRATTVGMVTLIGYITTSSTTGNIQLQFASQTSGQLSSILNGTFDLQEVQL